MSKESAHTALGKFTEAVNTGKFDLFEEVVAPDCIDHDPVEGQVSGPDGYRMFFPGMRAAFPDLSVTPETIVQDEDAIAIAYTTTVRSEKSCPPVRRLKFAECRLPNSKTARWLSVGEAPTKKLSPNRSESSTIYRLICKIRHCSTPAKSNQ